MSVVVTSASGGPADDGVDALSFLGTFSNKPASEADLFPPFFPRSSSSDVGLFLLSRFFRLSLSLFLSLSRGDLSLLLSFRFGEGDREVDRRR